MLAARISPEQQRAFVELGFLHVPGALSGGALANLRRESDRVEAETRAEWRGHAAAGTQPAHHKGSSADGYGPTHHVVLPVMAEGEIFPELLAHPVITSTVRHFTALPLPDPSGATLRILGALPDPANCEQLAAFMGPDITMSDNALCIKPPHTTTHVGWHRDSQSWTFSGHAAWDSADQEAWAACRSAAVELPMEKIKVMIYVDDVDETTGPFSIVPGLAPGNT